MTPVEDVEKDLLNIILAVQLNLLLEAAHEVDLLQSKNVLWLELEPLSLA